MGANDKVAATYHGAEYTPDTESVRMTYCLRKEHLGISRNSAEENFDRMLSKVRAEAKAEALEDFAKVIDAEERDQWMQDGIRRPGAQIVAGRMKVLGNVARTRANQYKEQS